MTARFWWTTNHRPRLLEFRRRSGFRGRHHGDGSAQRSRVVQDRWPPGAAHRSGTQVSGAAFIHDIVRPNMLHARILRQPSRGAVLRAFDEAAVGAPPRRIPRGPCRRFPCVRGEDETVVQRAAVAAPAHATWDNVRQLTPAQQEAAWYATQPADDRFVGDPVPDAIAGEVVTATYSRPSVAHAAMAPSCGLAEWRDGHCRSGRTLRASIRYATRFRTCSA